MEQGIQMGDKRGFATAGPPNEGNELSFIQSQIHILQSFVLERGFRIVDIENVGEIYRHKNSSNSFSLLTLSGTGIPCRFKALTRATKKGQPSRMSFNSFSWENTSFGVPCNIKRPSLRTNTS